MRKLVYLLLALAPCCLYAADSTDSSGPTSQMDEGTSSSGETSSFVAFTGGEDDPTSLNSVAPDEGEGLEYGRLRYSA